MKEYGVVFPQARGQILSKDGDIVVGQEYTDFDKGLDDGIEGDVSGFNMILASTTAPPKAQRFPKEPYANRRISSPHKIKGHYIVASEPVIIRRRISKSLGEDVIGITNFNNSNEDVSNGTLTRKRRQSYSGYPLSYFRVVPTIPRDKIFKHYIPHSFAQSYQNVQLQHIPSTRQPAFLPQNMRNKNSRISNEISPQISKPLGLQLVELSFNCEFGRGAPLKGREVLISWTKTPVRVFGGAILKKVDPFCYEPYIKSEL